MLIVIANIFVVNAFLGPENSSHFYFHSRDFGITKFDGNSD